MFHSFTMLATWGIPKAKQSLQEIAAYIMSQWIARTR